jgi:hypothetical protein
MPDRMTTIAAAHLRIEGSAARPIAPIAQMEKINRQIQLATG